MKSVNFVVSLMVIACAVQMSNAWLLSGIFSYFSQCLPWAKEFIETLVEKCWNGYGLTGLLDNYQGSFDLEGAYGQLKIGFEDILDKFDSACEDFKSNYGQIKKQWGWRKEQKKQKYRDAAQGYWNIIQDKLAECKEKVLSFIAECGYEKGAYASCIKDNISEESVCGIQTDNMDNPEMVAQDIIGSPCFECFGKYGEAGSAAVQYVLQLCAPYLSIFAEAKGVARWKSDQDALPDLVFEPQPQQPNSVVEISLTNSVVTWAIVLLLVFNAAIVGYLCWNRNTSKVAYKSVAYGTESEEC